MDTETLTVLPKGEDFEIIVQHDQTGSAYGITLSKNAYEQLRQHFVVGRSEQFFCFEYDSKGMPKCKTQCAECDEAEGGKQKNDR